MDTKDCCKMKTATVLVHAGRHRDPNWEYVNPPVVRASTVLHKSVEDMAERGESWESGRCGKLPYATYGTPTQYAFYEALSALEGGTFAWAYPTGLAACTIPLLAFVKAGDHLLYSDSIYGPTREFIEKAVSRMGVEVEAYDPLLGEEIGALIRPNTTLCVTESVGSHSFEVQDIPGIARACRARGVVTFCDATWGTPLYFRPLEHGIDIVAHAATKYIAGHSDLTMGVVVCSGEIARRVRDNAMLYGQTASPDDIFLAFRGLHSMEVRVERASRNACRVIEWLRGRPEVERVLYPALPDDPGYRIWKRDYTGATSLFGVLFRPEFSGGIGAMVNALEIFGRGYSWGGFESLLIPSYGTRTVRGVDFSRMVRIAVGLEDPDDLIADLAQAFGRLRGSAA